MVTRPLIESIASITRPRRRSVVGSIPWLKQAKTTIISGMGGGSWWRDSDWGIHILHGMSPLYLITSFGEGIVAPLRHGTTIPAMRSQAVGPLGNAHGRLTSRRQEAPGVHLAPVAVGLRLGDRTLEPTPRL